MKKLLSFIIMAIVMSLSLSVYAAPREEISSIDALDQGVADTGETNFTKNGRE